MPGLSKKPSFSSNPGSPHGSPHKKTVRLAENPHVSAFLSPKSRIFTGGHGYPGVPSRGGGPASSAAFTAASAAPDAFSISGKQLTPDEVAQKIASMLKPGPPFFSRVSNADLIDFISDGSIMNCDKLRAQAAALEAKKQASRAATSFVPSGTVVRRRAEEERWNGVGTVWSSLDGLPAGAGWGRIPGAPATSTGSSLSVRSNNGLEDDGLWNAITLSVDIDCTSVELGKSVVVPTEVLQHNNFFNGNAQSLFDDIGAGVKYKWDNLVSKTGLRHKASSSTLGGGAGGASGGSKIMPNYLSLSAYTDPNAAFGATSFELKWPSWMPWVNKKPSSTTPTDTTPEHAGGQKRVWIPSSTKVSIHASWWGYNLYLPQPVLDSLDGDVDEAEKIANLINKCLTYILNNVPAGLPPAFAAVVTILKAIAPTTGYISTFIGWSWDTIKSFNKGQGVVLSATWILPVALIPRAWDAPAAPVPSTPTTPTTPGSSNTGSGITPTPSNPTPAPTPAPAPSIPSTGPAQPSTGTDAPATAQDTTSTITDPELIPLPNPNLPAVPAPGATLPPTNPSTIPLDLNPPPGNNTSNAQYPGDNRGRGGDPSTSAPMGNTPAPANQVPIDAES
ncbi:uncharacterized protein UTRI_04511 [Ustilago trichophora]|uniref:Uncharacterized protein n=1 Tax=Ustilago trichophora TaxID=86804 RepID=A0A5C3EDG0_9BASI|nr:uncharacterized protein UTRI_04511 [Ustilago trichophora]